MADLPIHDSAAEMPPVRPAATSRMRVVARHAPLLVLLGVLAFALAVLLARGLNLGFTGDLLDYAYHYERLGTFGGMRWLVTEHLQRHLLAGLFSAPIAYLFPHPNQSWAWYAYAFIAHFAAAVMVYALANAVLRGHGRYRWIAVSAALIFAFHPLHTSLNFEFPTSGHGNSALVLALASLWLYLQYVRRFRRNRRWLEWSLATYVVALMTYEQTVLFFLLHPLIAYFEDRPRGLIGSPGRWLLRVAVDSFWFPVAVVAYLYLLRVLFPIGHNLNFSAAHVLRQLVTGLQLEFGPDSILPRLLVASGAASLITLAIAAFVVVAMPSRDDGGELREAPMSPLMYLAALGFGISLTTFLGAAPTGWEFAEHPRMIYPSAAGMGMVLSAAFGVLTLRGRWLRLVSSMLLALFVAPGVAGLFALQTRYLERGAARQQVFDAIHDAIPAVSSEEPPYLLIVADANPSSDLWLYAQDNRFPYSFDRLYGVTGMAADALYFDLDPALAPAPDVPGRAYNGQFIVVEPEGIYSALRPHEPIDPDRLVIVEYASATGTARVLDELPAEVVAAANIVERAPIAWRTNEALLETGGEG